MMFASLKVESKAVMVDLPIVCEIPDVFTNDIIDLHPERKVEFTID